MDSPRINFLDVLDELDESNSIYDTDSSFSSSSSSSDESVRRQHVKVKNFVDTIDKFGEDFKAHMRLTKNTVDYLISRFIQINPETEKNPGNPKISAKAKMYMYIWYISNTITYRQLGNLFGVAKSTAWASVRVVTDWLISISHEFIRWPKGAQVQETCRKFQRKSRIPGVIGAIDCTHIKINAPSVSKESYFDRNRSYSITLQAVVDADKKFTNIFCGEPGSIHDSRVLRRSLLFSEAERNMEYLFPNSTFLLGDSAYHPVKNWLVPAFKNSSALTPAQKHFNYIHSASRIVVENAFGALKGRFRRLLHFTEQRDVSSVVSLVVSACILSNLCIMRYDLWNESLISEPAPEPTEEMDIDEMHQGVDRRQKLLTELIENNII